MKTFTKGISKSDMLAEVQKHRKADQILQGTYGRKNGTWKGCAVACSLRSIDILKGNELHTEYKNHKRYETDLGIPEWIARLEDTIFEGLPKDKALLWPEQFIKAIPENVDLEPVKWKFTSYLMKENIERVLSLDLPFELKEEVVKSIRGVLSITDEAIKTGVWDESAARSAESAARSAARSARSAAWSAWSASWSAWSAARSARSAAWSAWSAARSAAWSAARSAESAARSAARSAESAAWSAWSAESAAGSARSAAYEKHAKKLLALLRAAK